MKITEFSSGKVIFIRTVFLETAPIMCLKSLSNQ